jgi:hypothetical protein
VCAGVGLCHGLSGNAFVFLRLFDLTSDPLHLDRAFAFAQFGLAGPHRDSLLAAPDVPSSLANGRGGCACFLAQLMSHMHQQRQSATQPAAPVQEEEAEAAAASNSIAASSSSSAVAAPPSGLDSPGVTRASTHACFPGLDVGY